MAGASWVDDEIIKKYPDADFRAYVVWLPMRAADARNRWDNRLLSDGRISHYWDEDLIAGTWFANHMRDMDLLITNPEGQERAEEVFAWDAFLLFGSESRWNTYPSNVIGAGSTVIRKRDRLKDEFLRTLNSQLD